MYFSRMHLLIFVFLAQLGLSGSCQDKEGVISTGEEGDSTCGDINIDYRMCDLTLSDYSSNAPAGASYDDSATLPQLCPVTLMDICNTCASNCEHEEDEWQHCDEIDVAQDCSDHRYQSLCANSCCKWSRWASSESAVSQYPYLIGGNTDPGVFCEPGYHAPDVPMFGWTVGMACASKCEGGTLTDDHCNCLCVSKADKESEVGLTNENQALKDVNANLLQQIEQAVGGSCQDTEGVISTGEEGDLTCGDINIDYRMCDLTLSDYSSNAPAGASYDDSATLPQLCPVTLMDICNTCASNCEHKEDEWQHCDEIDVAQDCYDNRYRSLCANSCCKWYRSASSEISLAARKKRNKRKGKKRKNKNKGEEACDQDTQTAMEDGTCCSLQNARWDWSDPGNMPLYPEECCKGGPVTMTNECPQIGCDEETQTAMEDGTCCSLQNARWDWSDPVNVPEYPEECCKGGPVTMANECPQIDADLALESEQALSNTSPEKFTSSALAESSVSQAAKLSAIVTYVFAAIGFLSLLHVGAKHAWKALPGGRYVEF